MNLEKNSLNKLNSMTDAQLKGLINEISLSLGADRKKTAALMGDLPRLRSRLESLSPSELEGFIAFVGKEKAAEIIDKINSLGGR